MTTFIRDNIFLICVVLYCIWALVWPYIRKTSKISTSQATTMINKGKTAILDIRDVRQYKAGHILNAVSVPLATFEERKDRLEKFKGQPLIIVDDNGKDADKAVRILLEGGFKNLNVIKGGMESWNKEGLPVSK